MKRPSMRASTAAAANSTRSYSEWFMPTGWTSASGKYCARQRRKWVWTLKKCEREVEAGKYTAIVEEQVKRGLPDWRLGRADLRDQ